MSQWTEAFIEVKYCAKRYRDWYFHAKENPIFSAFQKKMTASKADLMIACAEYRNELDKGAK